MRYIIMILIVYVILQIYQLGYLAGRNAGMDRAIEMMEAVINNEESNC